MKFVFRNYPYILLAVFLGLFILGVAILIPSFWLLTTVFADGAISLTDKIMLLWNLLGSLTTNFTMFSASTTVITSLLVGVNASLIAYLYRRQKTQMGTRGVAMSSFGMTLGMFGVGCAACGSLVLTALLASFGGIGLLAILPYQGQEIGVLGVLALGYATYFLTNNITKPIICEL